MISISILGLTEFFEFIGLDQVIRMKVFLGIDYDPDRYFYASHLPEELSVKDFLSFIHKNEIKSMDVIHFNLNDLYIEIMDCSQYDVYGEKIDVDYLQRIISHFTGFLVPEKDLSALNNKYILIDKGKVMAVFESFDEYLASEYYNLL